MFMRWCASFSSAVEALEHLALKALVLFLLIIISLSNAYANGVPNAVWQDSERSYRSSSPYGDSGIPLSREEQRVQAPRVRSQITEPNNVSQGALQMQDSTDWRLRINEAAVVTGDMVLLGEIVKPLGAIPPDVWESLRTQALWPSPTERGKPLQINKNRLSQALRKVLGDVANRCILPNALVIQRDGIVLTEDNLRSYVINCLNPQLALLPGRAELEEFRLPPYIFLDHGQQKVSLEHNDLVPGRLTFRFVIQEADGEVLRRAAGSAFLNLWVDVPAASKVLLKGDPLNVQDITFISMNAAYLNNMPWDGRGGPWQLTRNINSGTVIYQNDLLDLAMVRKGSVVELRYERGNVIMSVQAECLQDGEPGATIMVRNLQSKKTVYATIRDNKTVVIN